MWKVFWNSTKGFIRIKLCHVTYMSISFPEEFSHLRACARWSLSYTVCRRGFYPVSPFMPLVGLGWQKPLLHPAQSRGVSPVLTLTGAFKLAREMMAFPRSKGLSAVWVLLCACNKLQALCRLCHAAQIRRVFSPVWVHVCLGQERWRWNANPLALHWHDPFPVCILQCVWKTDG